MTNQLKTGYSFQSTTSPKLTSHPTHTIELYRNVDELPVSSWESVVKTSSLFLSLRYLKTAESSNLPGMHFRYAIIRHEQNPVAVLYFQLVNLSDAGLGGILNLEEYGGLAGSISSRINDILFSPGKNKSSYILVCGNLLVSGNHGVAAINDQEFKIAIEAIGPIKKMISQSMDSHARLVAFMVKDFYNDEDALAASLLKKEYFLLNTDPEMIFNIKPDWKNFDDYRTALSSKYRIRTNNVISKLNGITIRELDEEEIVNGADEIYRLNDAVIRKAPVKLARPSKYYFVELKRHFGAHYRLKAFYLNDQMIAFTSGLWNKSHYEAHFIGLDYKHNQEYSLYQNILYAYIDDAILCGSRDLYFGRTALEIKSTTGASPQYLACYFRFANRVLNTLAKPLVSSTGPKEWIPRDPFKN